MINVLRKLIDLQQLTTLFLKAKLTRALILQYLRPHNLSNYFFKIWLNPGTSLVRANSVSNNKFIKAHFSGHLI